MADTVYDANGVLIEVGSRVRGDGVVTRITDWDGDMREGRMVGLPPRVYVKWPEFDEPEDFITGMRPDERTYLQRLGGNRATLHSHAALRQPARPATRG